MPLDGACTNLLENFRENGLKRDLPNTTYSPFSYWSLPLTLCIDLNMLEPFRNISVADPDPGSWIRNRFFRIPKPYLYLDPGWVKFRIQDPG